jgi:O-antigen/teichoic acid export membrane protein
LTKDLRNKLFSQVVLALSQALFPFITYPIITSALGPQGLGRVVYVDSWVQVIGLLAGLGIPLYGIREIAKKKDDHSAQSKTFLELFFLQLTALLPSLLVLFFIGKIYQFDQRLLLLSLVALAGNALASEWYFQGKEAFLFITKRTVVIRLLTLLLIFFTVRGKDDIYLYYGILVGSVLLTTGMNLLLAFRSIQFSLKGIRLFPHVKQLNWVYGCYLLFSFYALTDSLILGSLAGDEAVGNYNLGYRLIRLTTMFVLSVGTVFIPKVSYLNAAVQKQAVYKEMQLSQRLLFFAALPFSFFFLVMAPELVSVFATSDFTGMATVIRIGSFIPLFLGLSHFAGVQVMLPLNKEKPLFLILAGSCALNLVLNFTLVFYLKEVGSALANLATELSIALVSIGFLLKKKLVQFDGKSFLQYGILSAVVFPVAIGCRSFPLSPFGVLMTTALVSGLAYFLLHYLLLPDSILKQLFQRFATENKLVVKEEAEEITIKESGT